MRGLLNRLLRRPLLGGQILLSSFIINLLGLASSVYVIQIFNRYVGHGIDGTLYTLGGGMVLALVLELAFRHVRQRLAEGTVVLPDHRMGERLVKSLTLAKSAALDSVPVGFRREALKALSTIQSAYSPANLLTLVDLPFALMFLGAVYLLAPSLGMVALVVLSLSVLVALLGSRLVQKAQQSLIGAQASQGTVSASLERGDSIRAFNMKHFLLSQWREKSLKTHLLRGRSGSRQAFIQSLLQSAGGIMTLLVIGVGAKLATLGQLEMGTLIGANILAARGLMMVSRFAQMTPVLVQARQSATLLARMMKLPKESEEGTRLAHFSGRLAFKDMAFRHPGSSAPLFESLSLVIEPGEVLVVSGNNGSGKTTLARLLVGLIELDRGAILVDGVDLRQIDPVWWRQQIVYLPQDPSLIHATLRENLAVLNPDVGDESLKQMLRRVGLGPFLDENPQGLDRMMEGGSPHLSRGILRRMALVRAMVSQGGIVLMDEPTDGLDRDGVGMIAELITQLNEQGRTLIVFSSQPDILQSRGLVLDINNKPTPLLRQKQGAAAPTKRAVYKRESTQLPTPPAPLDESLADVGVTWRVSGLGFMLITLFVSLALWANIRHLDVMSLAEGEIVTASKVQQVQHLEGGIVREILVQEGDTVEKGQPLIVLDSIASAADVEAIQLNIRSLKVDLIRLQAEVADEETLTFGPEWQDQTLLSQARNLFQARRRSLMSELDSQRDLIVQRQEEIAEVQARQSRQKKLMVILREQIAISRTMVSEALSSRYEHLNHLKEQNQLESRIEEDGAALKRTAAALRQAEETLLGIQHQHKEALRQELEETQRNLNELVLRLEKFEDSMQRKVLRAPVNGIIKTLFVVSKGGVVPPGGTVLEVVPGEDRLLVEARLPVQDVGHVKIGQRVIIRLASVDASKFGKLEGSVVHISPDSVVSQEGFPYYVVRISTKQSYFLNGQDRYDLVPGVVVTAGILTGERTVLEYIMGPFAQGIDFALSER
ncbi:MAG: HlyD family type I secretion periplasmic adaptor subunit [Magnetococcales bacterium]|nr:HlyD family type I secretion periplasmic adaptor subunit [Magnetococcales bacterium]